jgi:hypothetical protein
MPLYHGVRKLYGSQPGLRRSGPSFRLCGDVAAFFIIVGIPLSDNLFALFVSKWLTLQMNILVVSLHPKIPNCE